MDLSAIPSHFRKRISSGATFADFTGMDLPELPDWIGELTNLTGLYLRSNRLTRLPDSIGNLTNLTGLYLHDNRLSQLPDSIGNLTNLTGLHVHDNQLTRLPDSIGNLTKLTLLSLGNNQLTQLPDSIGNLTNLTGLQLHDSQLTRLPDSIGNLTKLTLLSLHGNRLTRLPDCIGNLTKIPELNLTGNQLTWLPDGIGNLTSLTELNLTGNQLTHLPRGMAELLTDLFYLRLDGNPLADPLPELVQRGTAELAAYLRSLEDAVAQYEAKVLLVGEGNVGKSSLVAALKGEHFVEGRPTTHGIEISAIPLRHPGLDVDMTLRMWDFGGQEVYRVSHQFFFSKRALYLVVWHARQGEEQDDLEGWLRRVRLRVGNEATALIVATHAAERRPDLDYPQLDQKFPGMLAGQFAIDSSNDYGIEELRRAIEVNASQLPQMGQRISTRWVAAREAVLKHGADKPQIPYREFGDICAEHGVTGDQASTLAKLMHDLGLIIYYDEDEGLKDVVVLNPDWLTRAISYVLNDRVTEDSLGVLDHRRLTAIWQDRDNGYPTQYHPYFLRLMEKFDVSYRLDGEQHSLVAQLVPYRRPALPWDFGGRLAAGFRRLALTCELSEDAPGLISWLTVRHHRDSTGRHWRHGVFLRHTISTYRSEALLELRGTTLSVEVHAPSPDMYLNELRASIERLITERWPGLGYRLWVPCPGSRGDERPCPGRFPLDALLRFRENGQAATGCYECGELRAISALLTGFIMPDGPLNVQLSELRQQVTGIATSVSEIAGQTSEIAAGVSGLTEQAAEIARQAARTADVVRRVLGFVAVEVSDCPRLFTLARREAGLSERARPHQEHYQLTLWCEHPSAEHPCAAASYDLDPAKHWFGEIAPYARLVVKTLQLVVPVAAALDIAALSAGRRDDAQVRLDIMKAIVGDLPHTALDPGDRDFVGTERAAGQVTRAEGQALRAVRRIILEKDPNHAFGDMRRVQSPAGDLLWVCADHYREYDPGLPVLPLLLISLGCLIWRYGVVKY
jgi:internalin A